VTATLSPLAGFGPTNSYRVFVATPIGFTCPVHGPAGWQVRRKRSVISVHEYRLRAPQGAHFFAFAAAPRMLYYRLLFLSASRPQKNRQP
jgi:hypothetical protein